MRVLHVAESAKGGVGTYLSHLTPVQIKSFGAENVQVLAPDAHAEQLGPLPAETLKVYPRADRSARSLIGLANALQDRVREFQPDVIHAHSTFAGAVARMVYGPQPRRPAIVYCPHGWAFDIAAAGWKVRAVTLAEQALARFSDRVIAISQHEARQALRIGIGADRIQLAVNGLPEAPSTPPAAWDDSRLKVLFVGRFDRQKGFDVLAKAAGVLRQRIVVRAAGAAVAGSGEAVATPDNVQMLGWLDPVGVQAQLQACDVAVVPSRWEGFGFVAAEALRAGKPVIASRVGALPELVEDGFNGRLTPAGDAEALAQALMMDGASARQTMGRRSRERYERRFTLAPMSESILAAYDGACRDRRRAPAALVRDPSWSQAPRSSTPSSLP